MTHLTIDEITNFVTMDKIDSETLAHASKVTTHIRECSECFEKVKAFQLLYDGYKRLGTKESFKLSLKNNLGEYKEK